MTSLVDGRSRVACEMVILTKGDQIGGSKAIFKANAVYHIRDGAVLD